MGGKRIVLYRGRDAFRGKRVVVLGNGVSGTEIASGLAIDDSIRVTASLRKPRYVIPRVSRGVPSHWRFFTRVSTYRSMALPREAVADDLKRRVLDVSGHPSQDGALGDRAPELGAALHIVERLAVQNR